MNEKSNGAAEALPAKNNFAIVGLGGFIAPKHLRAIADTGNNLVAAADPNDSVGIIDSYFPGARFFTEIERFDRYIEKLRSSHDENKITHVAVCTPNYLHDAHVRLALRVKAHAICEKPLVVNPWNLEQLQELEQEHGSRVYNVLQLRLHPAVRALKESLENESNKTRREIDLVYVSRRGAWYDASWKGDKEKSGGIGMNIGIHFFDLLLWLFGSSQRSLVHCSEDRRMSGTLELEGARVNWFLSVDGDDLPESVRKKGGHAHRVLAIDGQELDLSAGFTDLHTEVYRDILSGGGFGIEDARPSIELVYNIRNTLVTPRRNPVKSFASS